MVAVNTTQNGSTQASPNNEKTGTHTVPLKKLFEQLKSSELGLTGALVLESTGRHLARCQRRLGGTG